MTEIVNKLKDIRQLPCVYESSHKERDKRGYLILSFLIVIEIVVCFFSLIKGEEGFVILLVFCLPIGIIIFVLALTWIGFKIFSPNIVIRFTSDSVEYNEKSVFKESRWIEPVKQYNGILRRVETRERSSGSRSTSRTYHVLTLHHKDKEKCIDVYESLLEENLRDLQEHFARLFNLPALEDSEEGIIYRGVDDLDKSIHELVQENKLQINFNSTERPPPRLSLEVEGDALIVNVLKKTFSLELVVAFVASGLFLYGGFFGDLPVILRVILGIMGVLCGLISISGLLWEYTKTPQIRLSKDRIQVFGLDFLAGKEGRIINTADIEQALIKKDQGDMLKRPCVFICTDKGEEKIGRGLGTEGLEWLKNRIIAVISG